MIVKMENLTKIFPGRDKKSTGVTAVDNFSLELPDGKLVCLLGPSGCGKSTLLYMICGLESPTEGKIFFGDTDVTDIPSEKRGVGLVFQNYALYPHLTVKQIIKFPLENLKGDDKLSKEEMDKMALEAAKLVQIDGLMDRKPGWMSGGQYKRGDKKDTEGDGYNDHICYSRSGGGYEYLRPYRSNEGRRSSSGRKASGCLR